MKRLRYPPYNIYSLQLLLTTLVLSAAAVSGQDNQKVKFSGRTIVAEVVALDQPFMVNRLGSSVPTGQIFALRTDVMPSDHDLGPLPSFDREQDLSRYVGKVTLKQYKRPRPIVLRVNVGDILEIRFCNLLSGTKPPNRNPEYAGFHIMGMNLLSGSGEGPGTSFPPPLSSDSSYVGRNVNSFAKEGSIKVYHYFAAAEGTFILSSAAQPNQTLEIGNGLFGCAVVESPEAEYYRSQVTRSDLFYSTYYSTRLPANMLLHVKPGTTDHWILTTYKTRAQREALKNVDVIVRNAKSELLTEEHVSQENKQNQFFEFDRITREFKPLVLSLEEQEEKRSDMEAGRIVPAGYLYSAPVETEHGENKDAHPIIDYSTVYDVGGQDESGVARTGGSPILRMLYPVAKSLLTAQTENARLKIEKGAKSYQLPADPGESPENIQDRFKAEITELDAGSMPRNLVPVLNAWGVQETPNLTKVTPERSYISEISEVKPKLNYIWLLTGVTVNGGQNDSVLIQGGIVEGKPQLTFLKTELQLRHSDSTAIITGPQAGRFSYSQNSPSFYEVPALPDRRQPFREFVLGYHNFSNVAQAFPQENPPSPIASVLTNGNDFLAINYGIAGIATEIMANRLGVGPEGINGDEVDLKFEEFFLSSWAVGDPAMLVDRPANVSGVQKGRASKVLFPDDPSNVYHSYMRDHVIMRIYNAGPGAPHVHHLHAHQWLRSPNSDNSQYLDSELIVPGSAFSLDMVYNGSGNRNQTVGDSIFHCHFYPHFARGMWALWRVHDVFEEGTLLDPVTGAVKLSDPSKTDLKQAWVRALPDAEIQTGTPIPAVVPLPALGTAPLPARVRVTGIPEIKDPAGKNPDELKKWVNVTGSSARMVQVRNEYVSERDRSGKVVRDENGEPIEKKDDKGQFIVFKHINGMPVFKNPGYPFFVPGVAGHRPPHPPLAMAWEEDQPGVPVLRDNKKIYLDGGLPRHQVLGGQSVREFHTKWDFTKDFIRYKNDDRLNQSADNAVDGALVAYLLPEDGTPIEKAAMKSHATRSHETVQPDGSAGNFILNGLPPINGAPYADPGVDDYGNAARDLRKYKAAAVQKNVVLNKLGWHYPQERFLTLWQDVKPTFDEKRPPQPFFFRANGGETVEFWHTDLVPDYYQLDDFQVRTPTDIIGQHIHLVKFDVTSSDGAANGFNYEDGVFSPDEVRARIFAITRPWAEGSYKKLSQDELPDRKYDLFAFNNKAIDGVAGIDWSKWARTQPLEPVPWDKSYMQWQMSQGEPKPDPGKPLPPNQYLEPPIGQNWDGAMTTIMRFSTDPLLNNEGQDRTVRTVFTHDHFGPSTHQQTGLYGGLLVEPTNSTWIDPVTGLPYYDTVNRSDGGPTGWEAIIRMPNRAESYREFALELQDLQLAYVNESRAKPGPIWDGDVKNPSGNPPLFSFTDGFSDGPIEPGSVLYANFLNNGITLSDTAGYLAKIEKTGDDQWVVKDPIRYAYGPNGKEAAFYIIKKAANYDVFTPNLTTWSDPTHAINAPAPAASPSPTRPKPAPQLVSSGGGTYSFNYRNEPLNNTIVAPSPSPYTGRVEGTGDAADFSYSFASIKRAKPWNEVKPPESPVTGKVPPPLFNRPEDPAKVNENWYDPVGFAVGGDGVNDGKVSSYDPYTPLLRAYQNDRVQIRVLAGAHVAPHSFMAHGVKWLFEPSYTNSGYRNVQGLGLSEHFELIFRLPPATTPHSEADSKNSYSFADYLYAPSSDTTGLSLGMWGIIRSYDPPSVPRDPSKPEVPPIASLYRLPEAANPRPFPDSGRSPTTFRYPDIPDVEFIIRAKESPITYNDGKYNGAGPIQNQKGIVFVLDEVKEKNKPLGVQTNPGDPLILRVRAGDWIKITLQNDIPAAYKAASATVGVHPQLLAYDVTGSDGANIGFNPVQTLKGIPSSATQPEKLEYWWYAGDFQTDENGNIKFKKDEAGNSLGIPLGQPREMGAINLVPPDFLNQHANGLVGALIVEPANSTWDSKEYAGASAAIKDKNSQAKLLFREFVLIHQDDVNATYVPKGQTSPTRVLYALNNKTEDFGYRLGLTANPTPSPTPTFNLFSNELTDGKDPRTPVFEAMAGEHVRFRVVFPGGPGGGGSQPTFEIHGHSWQQEPYVNNSLEMGNNVKSQVLGAQIMAPNESLNILIDSAGGPKNVPGDYLFCDYMRTGNGSSGAWGILRVIPRKPAE
jgi:hypothetical protein